MKRIPSDSEKITMVRMSFAIINYFFSSTFFSCIADVRCELISIKQREALESNELILSF